MSCCLCTIMRRLRSGSLTNARTQVLICRLMQGVPDSSNPCEVISVIRDGDVSLHGMPLDHQ